MERQIQENARRRRSEAAPTDAVTPAPRAAGLADVVRLQQSIGNQAVARLLQRRIIPVYDRAPESDAARRTDQEEVDSFAQSATNIANAGPVVGDLASGGSLADIALPETIVVTGHGNVQTIQGYSGSEVAGKLKNPWNLPQAYSGTLRLNSCKAGDKGGFLGLNVTSMIEDVSNSLQGYQVTVEGLSGNVVVPPRGTATPGVPRSIQSDEAYEAYKQVNKVWTKLKRAHQDALNASPAVNARLLANVAEIQIGALRIELNKYPKNTSYIGSVWDALNGTDAEIARINREIAAHQQTATAQRQIEQNAEAQIDALYLPQIQSALNALNQYGVPFGDPSVTITHGPADRAPQPASAGGWASPSAWLSYFTESLSTPTASTAQ